MTKTVVISAPQRGALTDGKSRRACRRKRLATGVGVLTVGLVVGCLASPGSAETYRLRYGDTLSEVALRTDVSVDELAEANAISDVDRVLAGRSLLIPSDEEVSDPGDRSLGSASSTGAIPRSEKIRERIRRKAHLAPRFDRWARAYGVPPDLIKAVAWQESGWQNEIISPAGARGIGQLMPDTVRFVSRQLLHTQLNPANPDDNIRMSTRFLRFLLDRQGWRVNRAVGAYYQGLRSVEEQGLFEGTRRYVANVQAERAWFR